ncbi:MAG: MFS transporter [Acidobacteria bacterium]|nr:MFS transporter [Acidobacteriota bacterium]
MKKSRLHTYLSKIAVLKSGEEKIVVLLFFYFFLTAGPYTIIKSIRNATILERYGIEALPFAYLAAALVVGFVVAFLSKIQAKVSRHILIMSSLIFFAISGLVFIYPFFPEWVSVVYWVWANLYIVVLVTQFWILVNDIFNPREAKRLIGIFVSGGILGGFFCGILAYWLPRTAFFDYLLPIALIFVFLAVFVVNAIFRLRQNIDLKPPEEEQVSGTGPRPRVGFRECYKTVRRSRYLTILAAIVTVTLVVSTLVDFLYNSIVNQKIEGNAGLTSFFGLFNMGLMVVAFLLQLLMTSSFIRRFGMRASLLLYPLVLMICLGALALAPVLFLAVVLKGSDKSLSYSLNQSVRELLYIPVSPVQKYKAKIFIDMFVNRFAKGLGGIILLIVFYLTARNPLVISGVTIILIGAWIFLNMSASREYTDNVRKKLDMGWRRADQLLSEKVDVQEMKMVLDTLESKSRSPVLFALHLFDFLRKGQLAPELRTLLFQDSTDTDLPAGSLFLDNASIVPPPEDELDEGVLSQEVREIVQLDSYRELMGGYFNRVMKNKDEESVVHKMEIAKAIALMPPGSPLVLELIPLLREKSPEVIRYAAESAARLGRMEYVPQIIELMKSPRTRFDSQMVLRLYGPRIIGVLSDFLMDEEEHPEVRKGAVSTLSEIRSQEAVDILMQALSTGNRPLRADIIDALDNMRAGDSLLAFAGTAVMEQLDLELRAFHTAVLLRDDPDHAPPSGSGVSVPETEEDARRSIFKLLGLLFSHTEISSAFQSIQKGTREAVAYAVELLDNTLPKEIRERIIPLIEDSPDTKVKTARRFFKDISE